MSMLEWCPKSFSFLAAKLWNLLPKCMYVRNVKDSSTFKSLLKKQVLRFKNGLFQILNYLFSFSRFLLHAHVLTNFHHS